MKRTIFTELEANLESLKWVANRLSLASHELNKFERRGKNWLAVLIREYIIIQLDNFIDVRKKLLKSIPTSKSNVDKVLKPLWEPVFKYENAIKELRDSYLAHVQKNKKPFSSHVFEIYDKHEFPFGIDDLAFLGWCVFLYKDFLFKNLPGEVKNTQKKYNAIKPLAMNYDNIPPNKVREYLEMLRKKVVVDLKHNNLIF